jgi:peptidyl-prolyl cis-trans isomerase D
MLKFFNRLEKTRNFVLLMFAIIMVVSLVLFYQPQQNTALANLSKSEETAASVAGEEITVGEIVRQQENESMFMRGQRSPARTTVDRLVNSRIMRVEAARLGLTASDAEVADQIRKANKPTDGKPFDEAVYKQNVTENFGSISDYEETVRDSISTQKLEAFLTAGLVVSEDELLDNYRRKNTKFDLSYVAVNATDLAKKIVPTDAELREYFEKNKAAYRVNVPQKKIKYIFVNTEKIGQKLSLPEADLRAEYDNLPADKKIGGVLGQEIVLRVAKPEFDSQVQTKATELVQQLRKDGQTTVTEEAFAEIAKGYSESPTTAAQGGKLPGPVRENLNKPDDPYQRLLKMKPGEITEPISYQGRYFILRRGEDVPKPYETARKEIEVSLRNRRAYTVAAELAQKIVDSLKQSKDPQKTAAEFASQANMSVAEMIKETGFVKPGDDVPNIGVSPQFEEGIAPLNAVNDVGEKTPIKDGFAIPMLADRREPRDAEFDEVKSQIMDVVKLERARAQVEEIAKQIASSASNAAAVSGAASSKGLEAKEQKDYIIGSPLGEGATAATGEAIENAIFALRAGEVTKTPVKVGENWFIVGITKREDANEADFPTQRSSLKEQLLARRRASFFADFQAAAKQRFEADGKITIYKEVLDKIDAQSAAQAPAGGQ